MKKFKVSFTGRLIGAIGIFYKIRTEVEMDKDSTSEQILLKLYDKYDHTTGFKILN